MRIRPAEIADAAQVAQVNARSWQAAYPGIIPDAALAKLVSEQAKEAYWQRIIEFHSRLHVTLVAENDAGQIVGCVTFGPERHHNRNYKGELYSLYLLPEHHKQGFGRAMVIEAARQLKRQGMNSMLVWVLTENHPARGFYERMGGAWLCDGVFDASGIPLATVAYGWPNVSVLLPQTELKRTIPALALMESARVWLRCWLQRLRIVKKM